MVTISNKEFLQLASYIKGLLSMRRKGARTKGQYEKFSVAYDIGAVEKQVSLGNLPQLIYSMLNE